MLTAGRETYAAAAEELGGYAADASAAQLTRTADEILAVADLLRREPRLRRAMIDASRAPEDRAALLAAVLSGKVGDAALGLLAVLVRGRWATPGELLDGVERLG